MKCLRLLGALSVSFLFVACGDDTSFIIFDAGQDAGDDGSTDAGDDAAADAGDDSGVSTWWGACSDDSQCPGPRPFCRLPSEGYNMGTCTSECNNGNDCDDGRVFNWCLEDEGRAAMSCQQRCRNTVDCGRGDYVCVDIDRVGTNRGGRCVGYCSSDESCGEGAECNEQAGRCVAMAPTDGEVTGEPCAGDNDCLSRRCTLPVMDGALTGEVGGYCESLCKIAAGFQTSNFYLGDSLPDDDCPVDGDICIPVGNELSAGSEGRCFAPCTMDAQCREGRECLRTIGGKRFNNGICTPIDCRGSACPAGNRCQTVTRADGSQIGRCRPE